MKRFILILLILMGCATQSHIKDFDVISKFQTYTYDGELDPVVFFSWEIVRVGVCDKGHHHFLMENIDKDSDIKMVELVTVLGEGQFKLVVYRYFKYGIEHIFVLDNLINHYEQREPKRGFV